MELLINIYSLDHFFTHSWQNISTSFKAICFYLFMKFTMNPARAYLLGLWKGRRTKEGVGVEGHREVCEAFLKTCLDEKLAEPDKVKYLEGPVHKCYFYHSALRAWLDEEMEKRGDRFRFKNEFAASYFAGLFDGKGGFAASGDGDIPYIVGDEVDEMVLLRLGFRAKKEGSKIGIVSEDFYGWIMPYLRLEISKKKGGKTVTLSK
ncbi:Uncharacterised protein [uncultured archaeon]|nr:Uncharacterised protein [uncultured archaeon]